MQGMATEVSQARVTTKILILCTLQEVTLGGHGTTILRRFQRGVRRQMPSVTSRQNEHITISHRNMASLYTGSWGTPLGGQWPWSWPKTKESNLAGPLARQSWIPTPSTEDQSNATGIHSTPYLSDTEELWAPLKPYPHSYGGIQGFDTPVLKPQRGLTTDHKTLALRQRLNYV